MRDENNVRILLIDDDEEFCQLTRDYLELQNMILDYCTSGISGIQAIEKDTYDLILLDMMLPDEPGVQVQLPNPFPGNNLLSRYLAVPWLRTHSNSGRSR